MCAILTIFLLNWGPRMARSAREQFTDPERRARVEHVSADAFGRWQHYVVGSVAQAMAYGIVMWACCRALEVPAPTPLALLVAFISIVPYVGVIAGSVPALLITAGLESFGRAGVLLAVVIGLQVVHIWVTQPQVVERSRLYVGPLVLITSITLGYRGLRDRRRGVRQRPGRARSGGAQCRGRRRRTGCRSAITPLIELLDERGVVPGTATRR